MAGPFTKYFSFLTAHKLLLTAHKIALPPRQPSYRGEEKMMVAVIN